MPVAAHAVARARKAEERSRELQRPTVKARMQSATLPPPRPARPNRVGGPDNHERGGSKPEEAEREWPPRWVAR